MLNMFWVGVLAGVLIGDFAFEWLKIITAIAAFLLSGILVRAEHERAVHVRPHGHGHAQQTTHLHVVLSPWLIAIAAVLFAGFSWHYARKRGLQHLAQAELNTRWTNVKKVSSWGW